MWKMRWLLAFLYLLAAGGLYGSAGLLFRFERDPVWIGLVVLHVFSQLAGTLALTPWRYATFMTVQRLIVAAAAAALVLAVPTALASTILLEQTFTRMPRGHFGAVAVLLSCLITWTVLLSFQCVRKTTHSMLTHLLRWTTGTAVVTLVLAISVGLVGDADRALAAAIILGGFCSLYLCTWSFGLALISLLCRDKRKKTMGCCPACAYDLRGLSEMRCPECGRPFTFEKIRSIPEEMEFTGRSGSSSM